MRNLQRNIPTSSFLKSGMTFLLLVVVPAVVSAQVIFSETFNEPVGSTTGTDNTGGVAWSSSCAACVAGDWWEVRNGKFEGSDTNGPAEWISGTINTTGCSQVEVTFDVSEQDVMEGCGTGCVSADWVQFQYNINGSGWQDPGNSFFCSGACAGINVIYADDQTGVQAYSSGCIPAGNTLQIRIVVQCWAAAEIWEIDNIAVTCINNDPGTNGAVTVCTADPALNLFSLLGGTPDAGGTWSGPSALGGGSLGTFTPGTNAAGVYTYTVGPASCPETATVTVTVNSAPSAGTNGTTTVCSTAPAFNLFDELGGTPAAGGSWSGPSAPTGGSLGTFNPASMAAGVYTYTVGTAPCQSTATVTVTITALPDAGSNGAMSIPCGPTTDDLIVWLGGTPDPGGVWTGPSPISPADPDGNFDPQTMLAGTYTYTVGSPGCQATADVVVTITGTDPGTNGNIVFCTTDPSTSLFAQLGGSPGAGGSWSGPSALTGGSAGNFNPASMTAGTYTYTVGTGSCAASATVTVTVNSCAVVGAGCPVQIEWTQVNAITGCIVGQDGGAGQEDPAVAIYCDNTLATPLYQAEWSINITATGTSNLPGSPWGPCGVSNAFVLGIPAGSQVPLWTETFESDNGTCGGMTGSVACTNAGSVAMDLSVGTHTLDNGGTIGFNYTVTEVPIISNITAGTITCTGGGLYDAQLTVTYNSPVIPCGLGYTLGNLNVNGTTFPATGSPQTITLTGLPSGAVNVNAFFDGSFSDCFVDVPIVIPPVVTNAGTDGVVSLCPGDPVTSLFGLLGGTPDAGGTWSGPSVLTGGDAGNFDPATMTAGVYTYTVGTAPCSDDAIVTVTLNSGSDPSFNPTGPFCSTNPTALLAPLNPGGTWSATCGACIDALGNFSPSTAGAGSWDVTYTFAGACGGSSTQTILVIASGDPTITPAGPFCESDPAVALTAAQAGGLWSAPCGACINDATGIFDPAIAGAGTWQITYTLAGACGGNDTETITVNDQADATINPAGPFCSNDPQTIIVAADPGGTWSATCGACINAATGAFNPALATSGINTITYSIAGSCGDTQTLDITVNQATDASINPAGPFCEGFGLAPITAINPGGSWSATCGACINAVTGDLNTLVAGIGNHQITYTLAGPCPDTQSIDVTVTPNDDAAFIGPSTACANETALTYIPVTAGGAFSASCGGCLVGNTFDPGMSGAGTFTITHTMPGACGGSTNQNITVHPVPAVQFSNSDTVGCLPFTVLFTDLSVPAGATVAWDFGDGGSSSAPGTVSNTYTSAGCFDVTLNVTTLEGCSASAVVPSMVCALAPAVSDFTYSPDEPDVYNNTVSFYNGSLNASSYAWSFDTLGSSSLTDPTFTFPSLDDSAYVVCLTAFHDNGCHDTLCQTIVIKGEFSLYVPNAFTPDSDGQNDLFYPIINGYNPETFEMYIYDRWGEVVFTSKDPLQAWDGTFRGFLCKEDVYVWKIIAGPSGAIDYQQYTGHITLLR
jgi:gliding motility-associated-like protein